jgi:hypothetical protein
MNASAPGFRLTPRLVLGLGVLLAGVLLTADQLGFVEADLFYDYWPLLIMAVGATKLGGSKRQKRQGVVAVQMIPVTSDRVFALFWIAIGAWVLAWNLGYLDLNPLEVFWPLVLIIFGLTLVFGARRSQRSSTDADSRANIVAVMGGVDRQNSSRDFSGGDVTVFMGGGELDLRQTEVAGAEAVVQIFAMWGGYAFRVPSDWEVSLDVLPLLGGVSDLRTRHEHRDGAPRLTLKGVVIMGGIEIKN